MIMKKKKSWILSLAMTSLTFSGTAWAQTTPAGPAPRRSLFSRPLRDPAVQPAAAQALDTQPAMPAPSIPPASTPAVDPDTPTYNAESELPQPAAIDELGQPTITLPTEPMEPYLLQRQNGPFMVMAHTFHGPDAARYAQALAIELRNRYRMPAYVYFLRFQPGHSNIRDVPPTAAPPVRSGEKVTPPERYRAYDEAAVLVGDCKTVDESEDLLKQVKKVRSTVVDGVPSIWTWRKGKGLSRAMLTTNPLVASQELFPNQELVAGSHLHTHGGQVVAAAPGQTVDPSVLTANFEPVRQTNPLIKQMNSGPNSVFGCSGPFVLEVANFRGRMSTDPTDPRFQNEGFLKQSPLAAAADKAEGLAESLRKCKSLDKSYQTYVLHDLSSSRVYIGPFASAQDPRLKALLSPSSNGISSLNEVSMELIRRGFTQLPLVPSSQLIPVPKP